MKKTLVGLLLIFSSMPVVASESKIICGVSKGQYRGGASVADAVEDLNKKIKLVEQEGFTIVSSPSIIAFDEFHLKGTACVTITKALKPYNRCVY